MRKVALTIDVEQDVPPYLNTWRGREKGLPLLLELLAKHDIRATFFTTGKVAERYPKLVKKVSYQHEVGCHSYYHERLDRMSFEKQLQKIKLATKILTKVVGRRPSGFRAPNFKTNAETFKAIEQAGYIYDASIASYKTHRKPKLSKLVEIQNTWPSSFLRLPPAISTRVLHICLAALPLTVLDYHVWEVVKVNEVPFDCRFATGEVALRRLDEVFKYLLEKKCEFVLMGDIAKNKMAGYG